MSPGGQHEHSHGSPHFRASMVRANHDLPFGCWPSQGHACVHEHQHIKMFCVLGSRNRRWISPIACSWKEILRLWTVVSGGGREEGGSKTILFFALDTILSSLAREQRPVCLSPIAPPSMSHVMKMIDNGSGHTHHRMATGSAGKACMRGVRRDVEWEIAK